VFEDDEREASGQQNFPVLLGVGEAEMKSSALESFLLGVACGIGFTFLSLCTQKPARFVDLLESTAETGRRRRTRERQRDLQRDRFKAMGFSDEEIEEAFH
jgi:hypothetical protein